MKYQKFDGRNEISLMFWKLFLWVRLWQMHDRLQCWQKLWDKSARNGMNSLRCWQLQFATTSKYCYWVKFLDHFGSHSSSAVFDDLCETSCNFQEIVTWTLYWLMRASWRICRYKFRFIPEILYYPWKNNNIGNMYTYSICWQWNNFLKIYVLLLMPKA